LIKINLVREGRTVRGTGAAPGVPAASAAGGPSNLNNVVVLAFVVLGLLVGGGWWFVTNNKLKDRQATVASKETTAHGLEGIIKEVADYTKRKESLQKRIDLINQLKKNQKGPVKVMDRISQDLPELVWLDTMTISGGTIDLSGRGLNPTAVANFVDNIKNDPLFEEPKMDHLTQASVNPLFYSFSMKFGFAYAGKGDSGAAGGTGATTGTSTSGTTSTSSTAGKK
jgi:Tfp pilus assembly protein PilN